MISSERGTHKLCSPVMRMHLDCQKFPSSSIQCTGQEWSKQMKSCSVSCVKTEWSCPLGVSRVL
ncbi:hypothetical protein F2Q70_00017903 [Brassica cretica]|uniref:Uncharacterized protein n=1 Tax=Brassica cretica TaxID=69181 RepID=A0A3N6R124_BRACR|nr:hypothetical protein F2Q70_00017903 [Brassica cretica]